VSIGATVLQNQLGSRLPDDFISQLPGGGSGLDLVYSSIPQIRDLTQPLKRQVQDAFAGALKVVWGVMLGIMAIGALASLLMPDLPLQNVMDEKWGLEGSLAKEKQAENLADSENGVNAIQK
jgi:hypothetical protein